MRLPIEGHPLLETKMLPPETYATVKMILAGDRTSDVAEARGVAPCTVTNQLRRAEDLTPGLAEAMGLVRAMHRRQRRAN